MTISENQILRADDLYHVYDTEAVDGNFLTIIVDSIELDNSQQTSGYPKIGKGATYFFNDTAVDSVTVVGTSNSKSRPS